MVERVLADYDMAYGIRHAALRYFNAAGADPEGEIGEARVVETHLVPLMLDAVLGTRPPLVVMGTDYPTPDGTAVRDYIHVMDLADAHVAALQRLLAGSDSIRANLGTGSGYSVKEIVAAAEAITGRKVPLTYGPRRPGDPPSLVADVTGPSPIPRLTRHSSLESIIGSAWRWQSGRTAG
jgi:UDP-glucose 4-epimerase